MHSCQMRNNPLFLRNQFEPSGRWKYPIIRKQSLVSAPIELIACSDTRKNDQCNTHKGVHFFVDDFRFEGIYRHPERTLEKYKQYRFLLTPDFSVYADMPDWRQIESIGKTRWCGAWWQAHGLTVYPTVAWGRFSSYEFCYDGIEEGSVVAVGMIGCKHERMAFLRGYDHMLERIKPEAVICFGTPFAEMKGNLIPVDYLTSRKVVH